MKSFVICIKAATKLINFATLSLITLYKKNRVVVFFMYPIGFFRFAACPAVNHFRGEMNTEKILINASINEIGRYIWERIGQKGNKTSQQLAVIYIQFFGIKAIFAEFSAQ